MIDRVESFINVRTLGFEQAAQIKDAAVEAAENMRVSGIILVANSLGLLESSQAVGDPRKVTPVNVEVAQAKLKTVLNYRRSTSIQKARMLASGQDRANFAGQLGSLFGGGVAIFDDPFNREFLGGIAFSGGTQVEDEKIGRVAIWKTGFHSDLGVPFVIGSRLFGESGEINPAKTKICLACGSTDVNVAFLGSTNADQVDYLTTMFEQLNLKVPPAEDYVPSAHEVELLEQGSEFTFPQPKILAIAACDRHAIGVNRLYDSIFGYYQVIPEMIAEAVPSYNP